VEGEGLDRKRGGGKTLENRRDLAQKNEMLRAGRKNGIE